MGAFMLFMLLVFELANVDVPISRVLRSEGSSDIFGDFRSLNLYELPSNKSFTELLKRGEGV